MTVTIWCQRMGPVACTFLSRCYRVRYGENGENSYRSKGVNGAAGED
jgi:hypothetical protein